MPPSKKAKTTPDSSKRQYNSQTTRNTNKKTSLPKARILKKESSAQANTLFDFYPNLSKNAPLFRPAIGGEESIESRSQVSTSDDHNSAMSILERDTSEPELCSDLPPSKHIEESILDVGKFGPFALDDDDDDDDSHGSLVAQGCTESNKFIDRVHKQVLDVPKEHADSVHLQNHDPGGDFGQEIEMGEERDRFENADDEENEDEEWSWQDYNAENFGQRVSRDEAVLCPVCGESIITLSEHDRSAHVNQCLDLPPPSECENTVQGKDLIDSTVKRERDASPTIQIKREPSEATIKTEPQTTTIKRELSDIKREVSDVDDDLPCIKSESLAIKGEDQDVKPSLVRGASNAFDKIMVNHTEEKQWADAARTENAQRGTKYKTRVCPFYKILSPFPIAVDAFKYGTVPGIEGYYLTHFHSDHYGGLSSTWDAGPIYCSSITGSLVIQQLRVRPEYVVKLPMNTPTDVNGVNITLIDANHCPGSTLFLFEGTVRGRNLSYLHCGDFRATPAQLLHPAICGKKIDCLYLDTTYLSPKYAFPTQEDVIEACAHVCRDLAGLLPRGHNPVADARNASGMSKFLKSAEVVKAPEVAARKKGRLLVVVGTYSIGKERIVLGIAKALNSKIFAAQRKRDILSCLEDPELESRITTDPLDAQVHMTYLQEIRAETLHDYLTQFLPHFERIVGFRGTGWTYSPPKGRFLESPTVEQILSWNPRYSFHQMSPGRGSTSIAACYGVPYSEHSSFRELMCFCLSMEVVRIIPTVNIGSEKSRKNMKAWIDRWAIEVRKNGVRSITDAKEWK